MKARRRWVTASVFCAHPCARALLESAQLSDHAVDGAVRLAHLDIHGHALRRGSLALVDGRDVLDFAVLEGPVVDCHGNLVVLGGMFGEAFVGDACPGRADAPEFGFLGIERLSAVHLGGDGHWRLRLAVVLGEALRRRLGHGPALTVPEVVDLLDVLGLGRFPVLGGDHDVAAVWTAAQVDLG